LRRSEIGEVDLKKYDFRTKSKPVYMAERGLSRRLIEDISKMKREPEWMLRLRLKGYEEFVRRPMPTWGPDLSGLDFDSLTYFIRSEDRASRSWDDVPGEIKQTFERLGVPEMERKYLAGSVAQYESEGVYHNLKKDWESKGVIFMDLDSALKKHTDLIREYFMKCVPVNDNKFSSLHTAVWSGGSFAYVPEGVHVEMPLQTYFRMNEARSGQFEHTLIIAEPGSQVHYIEGCTAPKYDENSLHSAVVEIYAKEGAKVRYTTVQNWSKNIYNLNTKRAWVERDAQMEWVGGSLGAYITMLYPCSVLRGPNAKASHLNIAFGSKGTWKDGGAKVIHAAPYTQSKVIAKSISMGGGTSVYRGLVRINKGALYAKSHVQCDALMMDDRSRSETYPHNEIYEPTATFSHEASAGKISDTIVYYLMSRGLKEDEARSLIVLGFLDDVLKEIPFEFAIELNRLVRLEMEKLGAVG